MKNARKKALLMRPLIEACFFQLSSRDKFDPENIGSMYAKTTRANKNDIEKYGICKSCKRYMILQRNIIMVQMMVRY